MRRKASKLCQRPLPPPPVESWVRVFSTCSFSFHVCLPVWVTICHFLRQQILQASWKFALNLSLFLLNRSCVSLFIGVCVKVPFVGCACSWERCVRKGLWKFLGIIATRVYSPVLAEELMKKRPAFKVVGSDNKARWSPNNNVVLLTNMPTIHYDYYYFILNIAVLTDTQADKNKHFLASVKLLCRLLGDLCPFLTMSRFQTSHILLFF